MSEITPDEVSREIDSNSFQNLVANTIDEEHAIRVAFEAGIAFACRKQKGECFCGSHNSTFFGEGLISSTVDMPTVPKRLMCYVANHDDDEPITKANFIAMPGQFTNDQIEVRPIAINEWFDGIEIWTKGDEADGILAVHKQPITKGDVRRLCWGLGISSM